MLKKVKYQNWNDNFAYCPPLVDAVINTEHVLSVVPTESRGSGPWVKVSLVDGKSMICQGTPSDFIHE